ncbi:GNAT family N-acetyltransferase [Shewanella sp. OPT22]|uniref:GNAT family N-acetyltransferase n=1 Tax=Parashewanella hymeniacidonis TaxID=2807618 RepID=UPI0010229455|nr:GNAT family N-acetyltransferase [Parashewanella hymeniacidonis]MBM7072397.1 GNAT family N-acetyltransferase [Parashewanella hymeniacidonis]RYV02800.1 GNAT family N-acetyltransferase [Shewanella sp. OPT22]
MPLITTERLLIRFVDDSDLDFIFEIVNSPGYIQFIGDNRVRSKEHAKAYIMNGPKTSYQQYGFGLFHVSLKSTGEAIGLAGLTKREYLSFPELGYALLPRYWGNGYAKEAAKAVVDWGYQQMNIKRIMALVKHDNPGSQSVLRSVGFKNVRDIAVPDEDEPMLLMG